MTESELITKIKNHELGNTIEAFELYNLFCDILKMKYGLVDKDYDENPTKRGSEWLDIHHILEYELDDIGKKTQQAIKKNYLELLRQLKPYNVSTELVYANKIEHFLLHYLIDSIRGEDVFSGGPNFIWDCCVSLDLYGFNQSNFLKCKANKNTYYSLLTSYEVTFLYKKLIMWKNWNIQECSNYWLSYKNMIRSLYEQEVSYIEDIKKFFHLLNILEFPLDDELIEKINNTHYKVKTIQKNDGTIIKIISNNYFAEDEETVILFNNISSKKSMTIPYYAKKIAVGAFDSSAELEKITVPTHVENIEDRAFIDHRVKMQRYPSIKTIYYKGTKEEWDSKFSNVILNDIKLICKKQKKEKPTAPLTEKQLLYRQIITLIEQGEPVDKSPLNDMIKNYRALYGNN